MNYTENYHLPQWVKSDRIMMEDFNQMCADIDGELSSLSDNLAKNAQAAEALGQHSDARDRLLMRRMLRLAYNQYLVQQSMEPFPQGTSMFYQNGIRDLTADTAGGEWEGARFVGSGTESVTLQTFFSKYAKQISPLRLDSVNPSANRPLEVEICVPATTRLEYFLISGNFSENHTRTPTPCLLTLTNQDNGEVEQRLEMRAVPGGAESGYMSMDNPSFFLYFHVGTHYLLKLEPIGDSSFSCELNFGYHSNLGKIDSSWGGRVSTLNVSAAIDGISESSFGLLMVQCKAGGPDGRLTVTWDGQEVTPDYVRPIKNQKGLELRQMYFFRTGSIPAKSNFSVHFDCGKQGSIWFQEWGAILL